VSDGTHKPGSGAARSWRDLWQAPTLALGLLLLSGGLAAAMLTSPKPDYGLMLDRVESLLRAERHEDALAALNEKVSPYIAKEAFGKQNKGRFHQLRARAIYFGQRGLGISREDNNRNIVGEFVEAEFNEVRLTQQDLFALADTLIALGQDERAHRRMDQLEGIDPEARNELIRRMVVRNLESPMPDEGQTLSLLAGYLADTPSLTPDQRAWAEARQAELLIKTGQQEDAISKLLRTMPRNESASDVPRGELHLLLGRAYLDLAQNSRAMAELDRAMTLLKSDEKLLGSAVILRAKADVLDNNIAAARDRFLSAQRMSTDPEIVIPALLGQAEAEAALGNDTEATRVYRELIKEMDVVSIKSPVTPLEASRSMLEAFRNRWGAEQTSLAREYAELAQEVHGGFETSPPEVLFAIAQSHRRLADERLEAGGVDREEPIGIAELDPATREEVKRHLITGAAYYQAHAQRMVLVDNDQYAKSLWRAGEAYDLGGDHESAIRVFAEYANGFPNDQNQAEARFRVAQAHQVRGNYETAAEFYQGLIDDRASAIGDKGVGVFAIRSFVPLARCYLLDDNPDNDSDAESLLARVLAGEVGTPDAPEFLAAARELGQLRHRQQRYTEAIEHLTTALDLAGEPREHAALKYRLADAYRLHAAQIRNSVTATTPDRRAEAIEDEARDSLVRAMALFEEVRDALSRQERRLGPPDRLYLRNAEFYLGDCAFDLGDYERAIRFYEAARGKRPQDPASLVALIQIVNAYRAMGEYAAARTANERALHFYKSLPQEVWDDPDLPMTNRDWERWLDASFQLTHHTDGGD